MIFGKAVDACHPKKSEDVPGFFGSMAEFTASHTSTQAEVADTDGIILEGISKVIMTLGHGTDKDTDALIRIQRLHIVCCSDHGGLETESHLTAVGGQVIGDGILDDLQQLLLRIGRADGEPVKELNHQPGKPLESPRNTHRGVHFNQNSLGGMDKNLKLASLVNGGIEKGQEAL